MLFPKELCLEFRKTDNLEGQVNNLTQRIATLTSENDCLVKRIFELTENLSKLTAVTSAHRQLPALQRMLFYHIQQLPLTTDANTAPHHLLFRVLGCAPCFSQEILQIKIRCLLQTLHS